MSFLERKMFANGGPSTPSGPLGPNQIYDTVSGKIYNLDEGFVDNLFLKGRLFAFAITNLFLIFLCAFETAYSDISTPYIVEFGNRSLNSFIKYPLAQPISKIFDLLFLAQKVFEAKK